MRSFEIPTPGLGTMRFANSSEAVRSVETALDLGYRHIDTAQKYGTEGDVGEALANSDVPREDVVLATKVEEDNLAYDDVLRTTDESLDRLGVDDVDLLYVHWPAVTYDAEDTLAAFNDLLAAEKTRAVGLGNFTPDLVDEAREHLDEPPVAIQVEMHPYLQQEAIQAYAREHDVTLVAYCPVMRGEIFDKPEFVEIAADAGLGVVELSLAWLSSKPNVVPIPKASSEAHLRENLEATTRQLDDDVIDRVDAIDDEHRVVDPPEKGPWNW